MEVTVDSPTLPARTLNHFAPRQPRSERRQRAHTRPREQEGNAAEGSLSACPPRQQSRLSLCACSCPLRGAGSRASRVLYCTQLSTRSLPRHPRQAQLAAAEGRPDPTWITIPVSRQPTSRLSPAALQTLLADQPHRFAGSGWKGGSLGWKAEMHPVFARHRCKGAELAWCSCASPPRPSPPSCLPRSLAGRKIPSWLLRYSPPEGVHKQKVWDLIHFPWEGGGNACVIFRRLVFSRAVCF